MFNFLLLCCYHCDAICCTMHTHCTLHTTYQPRIYREKPLLTAHRSQFTQYVRVLQTFLSFICRVLLPYFSVWIGNCPGIPFRSDAFHSKKYKKIIKCWHRQTIQTTTDCYFNLKVNSWNWNALNNKIWWEYSSEVEYK